MQYQYRVPRQVSKENTNIEYSTDSGTYFPTHNVKVSGCMSESYISNIEYYSCYQGLNSTNSIKSQHSPARFAEHSGCTTC